MNITRRARRPLFLLPIICLLFASLACGISIDMSNPPTETSQGDGQGEVSNTIIPTLPPQPTPTAIPVPVGFSRTNPFPGTELVSVPYWDVKIIEVKRGADAWQALEAANKFNEPAPEGMEYILVQIQVKSTYTDSDQHTISFWDFGVTGDRLINYTCRLGIIEPGPELDAQLFTGEETEGWLTYLVAQGESNLILVVDEVLNTNSDARRYVAIDDGASIGVQPELETIQPSTAGIDINSPAPKSEKLISDDWELSITDVIRGEQAWEMVQEANKFNQPPQAGFEYIAVKLQTRFINSDDTSEFINAWLFTTTGSAGVIYDIPFLAAPAPELNSELFPGGIFEGWIVTQAAIGDTNLTLIFEPLADLSGTNKRYISLEP